MMNMPWHRKARDLSIGEVFRFHVYCEVLSVTPVANGKRIKIKIQLEDQRRRANRGTLSDAESRKPGIEFTDDGHTLEFLCPPTRTFHLTEWYGDDDDDDGEREPVLPPDDGENEPVVSPEGADTV
jgi:hypothetical protein